MNNKLQELFYENNNRLGLINSNDKVLLTVSGGIDSMTLVELFAESGVGFAIAHCNFQLRGEESDGDQQFVEKYAKEHRIDCFTIKFNTKTYAKEKKLSIQMAARELRYNWFEKIAGENGFSKIATAHNLNDVVETFFINISRGTGIKGLTGIKPVNGNIIRPLLFATRKEIENYALSKGITWREDSSNSQTKYLRNAIRHNIIPQFEQLNPSFLQSVLHATQILNEVNQVFSDRIENIKNIIVRYENDLIYFNIGQLKNLNISAELFFEIISEYGFSFDVAEKILKNLNSQPGQCYFAQEYKIVKDRNELILQKNLQSDSEEFLITEQTDTDELPIKLKLEKIFRSDNFLIRKERNIASFDYTKLKFPLKLRRWKEGDFFYPFGMDGRKKISDYFTDHKFSLIDKENAWLLLCGEDIIWIVNHRADNRYRITEKTKEILQIHTIG
jgi:tRNA(Ile)-lysidine synthase